MRRRSLPFLALTALALALAAPLLPASAEPGNTFVPAGQGSDHATEVLHAVEGLMAPKDSADAQQMLETKQLSGYGSTTDPSDPAAITATDPTLALRDLYFAKDDLTGAERQRAERLLARPQDAAAPDCSTRVCVHRQTSGTDAASASWTTRSKQIATSVLAKYADAGYSRPKNDGDNKVDIYLQDLRSQGVYGYCANDDMGSGTSTAAYCVLDNDYKGYPNADPAANLEVTAAHELFHAIQFGYDAAADMWFMEATATWAEEQVYDRVNDNRQYLSHGQLGHPGRALDAGAAPGMYGNWLFFEFLTQQYRAKDAGMATIVRGAWRNADSRAGKPDLSSIAAIDKAIRGRGGWFNIAFARFAAVNQHPGKYYPEGHAYRHAPRTVKTLGRHASTTAGAPVLNHLGARTFRFNSKNVPGGAQVRIKFDAPGKAKPYGFITIYRTDGSTTMYQLAPKKGTAARTVGFASGKVKAVGLTLVNAGRSYRCGTGSIYTCEGKPLTDGQRFRWSVTPKW